MPLRAEDCASPDMAWCDSDVNWSNVTGAVFRTTWDYFDPMASLLERGSETSRIGNYHPAQCPRHPYAGDSRQALPPRPPSLKASPSCRQPTCTQGAALPLFESDGATGDGTDVVAKPAIAGGAYDTYRRHRAGADTHPGLPHSSHARKTARDPYGVRSSAQARHAGPALAE